jgi:D-aspartate ligase
LHEYVVQPLIDGYDIDCSVLCENGRIVAYTIQRGIVSAKVRFRAAVGIEFLYDDRVLHVVEKMMTLLNWSGVAHVDLRYDAGADEIKVIEINARYWGSLLGSLNAGINFPILAVKTAQGESIEKQKFVCSQYFMGKAPLKQLTRGLFGPEKNKVRLRDTSLYYTLKDPMPVLAEIWMKIKSKF